MRCLLRWFTLAAAALSLLGTVGCTTPASLALSAVGIASNQSVAWDIVKHLHAKLTEGDPPPCIRLDPLERALSPRCGEFVAGDLRDANLAASPFGACALATAARDTRLWPALPELLARGARAETCAEAPLVELAQANDCPALGGVTPEVRATFATLAHTDPRSVDFDVVRWLSCPASRAAGLDHWIDDWLAAGALEPGRLAFSPLSALDPSALGTPLAIALEAHGHQASSAFDGYRGTRPGGFEAALRASDWAALDWWLARAPHLASRVPDPQLDWLPLARVLTPGFLAWPEARADTVRYLLARGADARARLPADPSQSVVELARTLRSPELAALQAAPAAPGAPLRIAVTQNAALRLIGPGSAP